ncbi:MAG: DivIVA domain-containing protein [Candidatus Marinimicrobia bacterium]|jgi:cell division initiation protein|nr:DivIVA domain-containing protein [Candidatus Neomarinimicrobiota bacterium]MBT3575674.1 DivIVA domain-containing protein [Candidatus Neomarinimicrobiota bacterium]MBT3679843.1 DivIVA domain-containing protein [Candidatus Neomarinimicrobiota bacterium]MBT3952071.1 DivIVA domain-containing protein [Candidatus Neomarinimicrobiota bacterium]MBT4251962.1 DivIVA domain-containing protein [Candidatus Neomarinimicrobiota bacterium]
MGRLTPQDIRDQEFKQSPLGYSKDQVNEFLEELADELETLIRESNEIHVENKEARLALTTYMNVEDSLKETLLLAQKTAQETLKNAQNEADTVLRKANTEKEALLFTAHQDIAQIQNDIRKLQAQRDSMLIKLTSSLRSNLEVLEEEFSNKDDQESFAGDTGLGEERIVDFSKNDLIIDDLPQEHDEPEINIMDTEDLTQE